MSFLSNGDFVFPFGPLLYWFEHIFVWSFQTGALNLEGIIRLPMRLANLLVFQLFGNLAVGYFYLLISLIVVFFAFYFFSDKFLKVQNKTTRIVGSLLFTLNPIFLGNLAKVGLIVGVAMLPLSLVVLRQLFVTKKLRYLLVYVLLLNVSLVHPYTFTVNLLVSGGYFLYLAWKHWPFMQQNLVRFVGMVGVGILLNAYFILPLVSLGTIDKGVLSQDISDAPIDYTALVNIANTGDMFTAFSLSKNVFKDFDFYSGVYQPIYFAAVFAFYALLLGLYLAVGKVMRHYDKKRFLLYMGAFLGLLVLSTATFMNIDTVIKFMIDLPGGWMFRSPLKWQLYMPLVLFASLVLLLKYIPRGTLLHGLHAGLVVLLVAMSSFVGLEVYKKLLVPRQLGEFSSLHNMNLDNTTMLFANTDACMIYAQEFPGIFTEFNQVMGSKNVQLKRVNAERLNTLNLENYDYVLGCMGSADDRLAGEGKFSQAHSFADSAIVLYKNNQPKESVYAFADLFSLSSQTGMPGKADFVTKELGQGFNFIEDTEVLDASGLYDIFETMSPGSIKDGEITATLTPNNSGVQELYSKSDQKLYYQQAGNKITLNAEPTPGFSELSREASPIAVSLPAGSSIDFRYKNPAFAYENLIKNPSFEEGLWQEKVADCNEYDDAPVIGMKHDKKQRTDGHKSLLLEAKRHIACTGPGDIPVKPGARYMLSFDYWSSSDKRAGFFTGFDDENGTAVGERLAQPAGGWQHYTKILTAPEGATSLSLLLYAYPDYINNLMATAQYDNFNFVEVPDLQGEYFLLSKAKTGTQVPGSLKVEALNPTTKIAHVQGAKAPFYVAMKESFNPRWRLELNNSNVSSGANSWLPLVAADHAANDDHFRLDGSMNGWFVDPAQFCAEREGCHKNPDGSYDMELMIEFSPQRWLYVGMIVSSVTLAAVIGYFAYARQRGSHE